MRLPWQRRRDDQDRELDDEIRAHFTMAVADRIARGESPEAAVVAARREFGNVGHVKEVTRETWGGMGLERLAQDVRYAGRSLRRAPVFAATAVLTLALGIGVSTAMFTVVRSVLLRPLPFAAPDQLYSIWHMPERLLRVFGPSMPDREFDDFARSTKAFSSTASFRTWPGTLLGAGDPARVPVAAVTPGFLATLGVRPRLGHEFPAGSDRPAASGYAIISASMWRERFGADTAVLGRSVTVDGFRKTIVGVMPDGFDFPRRASIWVPLEANLDPGNSRIQFVIGRLAPRATLSQASAELSAFALTAERNTPPNRREHTATGIGPLREALVGDVRTPLLVFAIAVGMLLLIACANVSNLMLMRATTRRHELGIRAALGAGRGRLVRQMLTESLVVAALGGVLGLGAALAGVQALMLLLPPGLLPRANEIHADPVVIVACAILCMTAGLLAGTLPAIIESRRDPREVLSEGVRTTRRAPWRRLFVVVETSLSLALLIGAGLMIRSFERLRSVDLGFSPDGIVTASIDLPETRYRTAASVKDLASRLLERIVRVPGVRAVAAVNWLPLDSTYIAGDFTLRSGRPLPRDYMVLKPCVSANYFGAMGIRVREGRGFLPSDEAGSERVVVISQSMAHTLWPNGHAVGEQLTFADKPGPGDWMRIVGVVDDVTRNGPGTDPMPALYRPIAQVDELFFISHLTFVARTTSDPSGVIGAMRTAVYGVDPEQPVNSIATMDSRVSAVMAEPRFRSIVLIAFSVMALLMAAVGIYGVVAYTVSERTRELGIRVALGASPRRIVRHMLAAVAASAVPGVLIGLAASLTISRLVSSFLFEVTPTDPLTYGMASAVILLVAFAAGLGPARRAGRVDPMIAMK